MNKNTTKAATTAISDPEGPVIPEPEAPVVPDPEELVEYTAPIDVTGKERDLLVGVNGEFIRIQRGKTVQIKRKFREAIENANQQQLAALMAQQKAEAESNKAIADL